ncbi:hypothetical protein CR194_02800 [Salipaludibacillus keqinensis]|uniref:Uncharacterized protein n=1 Tax=Salipaludibacillus keqinensis TaxID=2045207 RepID=A0A323TI04_9BACI|nr:hypothetical protein [Salipaludibacillus keqinensis]PYZ94478.1 hypothetical protein CR194_02800 [Salipaludibacillus keqinensis]
MGVIKSKKQFLVTDEDFLKFNKFGLPIEVFCPNQCETVAFGFLQQWDYNHAFVSGRKFERSKVVFFGK